ncbi:mandelate racemase/muconate lactonizing enzyme family protein [Effusibacillus lacus]|uniref:Isomerase n=1 Tax=Effusibacillus lacus TaxID=1348429 RepID=A0A292YP22_9BACL|nr:mandelate racemase/muconate lactonizing enzyme family protein [Effusibacillus lacus]TCS72314.1 D-galactarolactone cycloisomerase [Effusibacillus lacus]GAX90220.1 isomerase [Effusibacillus lacus]
MLIERIDTFPLLYQLPQPYGDANGYKKYRSCYLFRITTRSGIEGWGEIIDWLPTLDKGFRERIIPCLLGKKATDRLHLVKTVKKWHQRTAAGVSMALTEIVAKSAGLSVTDLWGGAWREKVPVYASFQSYSERDDWIRHSLGLVEKAVNSGFQQIKVKIGGRTLREDQDHIRSLQHLLEGKIGLAVDANQSYDLAAARQWEPLFRKWARKYDNLLWLEEPMPMNRVSDYKRLRTVLPVPVAGGENLKSAADFLPLLQEGALDMIQPDVMHGDGIEGYRDTLQLGRHFGTRVSPHAFDGGLSRLYALFAHACLAPWSKMDGNKIEPVEWDFMENPFTALVPLQPVNGKVAIPSGTGIGVELNQDILEKHRWDGSTYV